MSNEGRPISEQEAREMCERYQNIQKGTKSIFFDAQCIKGLTEAANNGLRVHLAMNADNQVTVILDDGKSLMEFGQLCPPWCENVNTLQ